MQGCLACHFQLPNLRSVLWCTGAISINCLFLEMVFPHYASQNLASVNRYCLVSVSPRAVLDRPGKQRLVECEAAGTRYCTGYVSAVSYFSVRVCICRGISWRCTVSTCRLCGYSLLQRFLICGLLRVCGVLSVEIGQPQDVRVSSVMNAYQISTFSVLCCSNQINRIL